MSMWLFQSQTAMAAFTTATSFNHQQLCGSHGCSSQQCSDCLKKKKLNGGGGGGGVGGHCCDTMTMELSQEAELEQWKQNSPWSLFHQSTQKHKLSRLNLWGGMQGLSSAWKWNLYSITVSVNTEPHYSEPDWILWRERWGLHSLLVDLFWQFTVVLLLQC